MAQNRPVRRGQLIAPWGVASMVNFPGDETLMVSGLDAWEGVYQQARDGSGEFRIREERLEKRLGVSHFRYPPDFRDPEEGVRNPLMKIPCVRFPRWHYCPRCGSMEKLSIYGDMQRCKGPQYNSGRSCRDLLDRRRPWLIPVRFVAVCGVGHIEDFPFMEWVHRDKPSESTCRLRLRAGRSASTLSGIEITCSCGTGPKTMAGAFNEGSLRNIKLCGGERPWLGQVDDKAEGCPHELRVVQRGASNVYFPEVRSSIYLPKWDRSLDRRIVEILENNWEALSRSRVDGKLNRAVFEFVATKYNLDVEKLLHSAEKKILQGGTDDSGQSVDSEELYRKAEYDSIISEAGGDNQDFFVTNKKAENYDETVKRYFSTISLVHKLRETRALVGFSRWLPEDGRSLAEKKEQLALRKNVDWLPALIVRGEGVFIEFNNRKIEVWAKKKNVLERAEKLIRRYNAKRLNRGQRERPLNPRFILLHTFAHVLINQFSFECGYGSSALRERVYCNAEFQDTPMNGILIYTASGDSEGSLGGLVRQGQPGNLEKIVENALGAAKWCSYDPVCIDSLGQGPDSCNLSACHGCALLPETSCEEGNRLLDRAMLVGTPEDLEMGYFMEF
ncbi:MAG: DUF1998 domain-containing protein [Syntrophorhabdus sp.]|nr:DUF1998 domain-containing protein [Syntrophorhabdus sp.]